MCRRWNWRNGQFSKITESSKHLVINIDDISPVPATLIGEASDHLASLLVEECRASLRPGLLSKDQREIDANIPLSP